jgi:hypothetical protein
MTGGSGNPVCTKEIEIRVSMLDKSGDLMKICPIAAPET